MNVVRARCPTWRARSQAAQQQSPASATAVRKCGSTPPRRQGEQTRRRIPATAAAGPRARNAHDGRARGTGTLRRPQTETHARSVGLLFARGAAGGRPAAGSGCARRGRRGRRRRAGPAHSDLRRARGRGGSLPDRRRRARRLPDAARAPAEAAIVRARHETENRRLKQFLVRDRVFSHDVSLHSF